MFLREALFRIFAQIVWRRIFFLKNKNATFSKKQKRITKFVPLTPESNSGLSSSGCGLRIYMYIHPATSGAATHFTRHILPRHTTHGRGFPPIATAGSVLVAQQRKSSGGLSLYPALSLNETTWGILYLFPSQWFQVRQISD